MVTRSTIRQLLSATPALLLSFLTGCKTGYTQVATKIFMSPDSPFPVSINEVSWIGSISYAGTGFTLLSSYFIGDKFGRKTFLIWCLSAFLIFWMSVLITSSGIIIVAGLFLHGISSSMHHIIGTIYIGEIATPQNREICCIIFILANGIGVQVEFFTHYLKYYRLLAAFPAAVAFIALILCIFYMVESPYYLMAKNDTKQAKKNLWWLNETLTDDEMSKELNCMEDYVNENRSRRAGNFKIIFQWENLKLLLIMMFVATSICFSLSPLMALGPLVIDSFEHLVDADLYVGIYNITTFAASTLSFISIKIFNRRSLAISGFIMMAILESSCAYCYYYEYEHRNDVKFLAVVIEILLLSISFIFYGLCSSSIQVLKSEIFPHKFKEFYNGVLVFSIDLLYFIITKLFFTIRSFNCLDKFFAVFAVLNVGEALVVYLFLSETKNKELYQIKNTIADCDESETSVKI